MLGLPQQPVYRLGDITAEDINTVFSTVEKLVQRVSDLEVKARNSPTHSMLWMPTRLLASQEIDDELFRFRYSWERVTFNAEDENFDASDLAQNSTVNGDAFARAGYNGADCGHTVGSTIIIPGIDMAGPAYPAGFQPKPISGNPVVPMFVVRGLPTEDGDVGGRSSYFFCLPMAHDGTCEAGTPELQQSFFKRLMSGLGIRRAS